MKERPILFNGEMVRAILEGRKTQTRRIVKPQPDLSVLKPAYRDLDFEFRRMPILGPTHTPVEWGFLAKHDKPGAVPIFGYKCPYGQPGDRLWVRETWMEGNDAGLSGHGQVYYRATWGNVPPDLRWRPSIHMPRWASRIILEITAVRVERLQDISREDAKLQGFHPGLNGLEKWNGKPYGNSQLAFEACWKDINGQGSWEKNPWVWVIEFKRI